MGIFSAIMDKLRGHSKSDGGAQQPAAATAAATQDRVPPAVIKLGLDMHAQTYVVVAQHDHAALRLPRRCGPAEFVPWVEKLLVAGHTVHGSPITVRRYSPPPPRSFMRRVALALGCAGRCKPRGRTAW